MRELTSGSLLQLGGQFAGKDSEDAVLILPASPCLQGDFQLICYKSSNLLTLLS